MRLDGTLPGVEHFSVVGFLSLDTSAVLKLCKLGSTLFVHFLLKVSSHGAISLANLHEDISLVSLLCKGVIESLLLVSLIQALELLIDLSLVVLLQPLLLLSNLSLQHDVSFSVGVHILHQVDLGLVLTSPLLLSSIPLFGILVSDQLVDHFLVSTLVRCLLVVVSLKFLNLTTASQSLVSLKLLNLSFVGKSLVKELLITIEFSLLGLLSKLLLGSIMLNKLKVTLAVKKELLMLSLLLSIFLGSPLSLEHVLLIANEISLLLTLQLAGLLLPVKNSHGVTDLLLLLLCFSHLSFEFLLSIKLPELGIHLLFNHFVLNLAALVDELLFTLNGSSIVVELLVLLAKSIVSTLELHVLSSLHLSDSLLFALGLKLGESGEHLLTDLLWGLKTVLELLLVHAVLSIKKGSKLGLSLFEVAGLSSLHVSDAVLDDVLLNELLSLLLPESLVTQVVETLDVLHLLGVFLFTSKAVSAKCSI